MSTGGPGEEIGGPGGGVTLGDLAPSLDVRLFPVDRTYGFTEFGNDRTLQSYIEDDLGATYVTSVGLISLSGSSGGFVNFGGSGNDYFEFTVSLVFPRDLELTHRNGGDADPGTPPQVIINGVTNVLPLSTVATVSTFRLEPGLNTIRIRQVDQEDFFRLSRLQLGTSGPEGVLALRDAAPSLAIQVAVPNIQQGTVTVEEAPSLSVLAQLSQPSTGVNLVAAAPSLGLCACPHQPSSRQNLTERAPSLQLCACPLQPGSAVRVATPALATQVTPRPPRLAVKQPLPALQIRVARIPVGYIESMREAATSLQINNSPSQPGGRVGLVESAPPLSLTVGPAVPGGSTSINQSAAGLSLAFRPTANVAFVALRAKAPTLALRLRPLPPSTDADSIGFAPPLRIQSTSAQPQFSTVAITPPLALQLELRDPTGVRSTVSQAPALQIQLSATGVSLAVVAPSDTVGTRIGLAAPSSATAEPAPTLRVQVNVAPAKGETSLRDVAPSLTLTTNTPAVVARLQTLGGATAPSIGLRLTFPLIPTTEITLRDQAPALSLGVLPTQPGQSQSVIRVGSLGLRLTPTQPGTDFNEQLVGSAPSLSIVVTKQPTSGSEQLRGAAPSLAIELNLVRSNARQLIPTLRLGMSLAARGKIVSEESAPHLPVAIGLGPATGRLSSGTILVSAPPLDLIASLAAPLFYPTSRFARMQIYKTLVIVPDTDGTITLFPPSLLTEGAVWGATLHDDINGEVCFEPDGYGAPSNLDSYLLTKQDQGIWFYFANGRIKVFKKPAVLGV